MISLKLFPNTGHQFFTLDLEQLLSLRKDRDGRAITPPPFDQIRQFVRDQLPENSPVEKRDKLAGWMSWSDTTPWLLYRYDFLDDPDRDFPRPVLQLAVESNTGDWDRGTVFGIEHIPEFQAAPAHPLFNELRRKGVAISEAAGEDALPPYVCRQGEVYIDYPDGGMWLEDAFGGGQVRLPSRLDNRDPRNAKYAEYFLPKQIVRIEWTESQGARPVEVDLIVDLGNTRTVALLLEDHGSDVRPYTFGERVEPVRFLPRGWPYDHPALDSSLEPFGLIDSWILVHRSSFANLEPPFSAAKLRTFLTDVPGDPGKKIAAHLIDQRFVSLAPVIVGGGREPTGAAKTLAWSSSKVSEDLPFFLSSPKRYAWDDTSIGLVKQYWLQVPNRHDASTASAGDGPELSRLDGMIRLFMNPAEAGYDLPPVNIYAQPFDASTDYARQPAYPRRDAICWFALSILETAYQQISSVEFLSGSKLPRRGVIRRLRRIRVTYPSGWSGEEREAYLDQWRRAINLFSLAHLTDPRPITAGGDAPSLVDDPIDEAIASQLPLLVAEIKNLGNNAREWLKLYGNGSEARVMNIDIGGGTTDIAVISYFEPDSAVDYSGSGRSTSLGADLQSRLLFRDGENVAGDVLVKRLIEKVILPRWLKVKGDSLLAGNTHARALIQSLFTNPRENPINQLEPDAAAKLSRIARLAFIPLANQILGRLARLPKSHGGKIPAIKVSLTADRTAINDLNRLVLNLVVRDRDCTSWSDLRAADLRRLRSDAEFTSWFSRLVNDQPSRLPFFPDAELEFTVAEVEEIIDEVFVPLLRRLTRVVLDNKCDLVIISGKPSELPRVRTLVARELPILPQRIIRMRGYCAGDWYPPCLIEEGGRIRDAKTVTVTGAALYEDIKNRNTVGLRLVTAPDDATSQSAQFDWGILTPGNGGKEFVGAPLFNNGETSRIIEEVVNVGTLIGRALRRDSRPEPVYRFDYKVPDGVVPPEGSRDAQMKVKLRLGFDPLVGEHIELVPGSVMFVGADTEGLDPACIKLRLRTMIDESFWMDQPRFTVDFTGIGNL